MKKERGITLITLVVTVIILIILAGVTLNFTIGDNGIITKTKQARENIVYAGEKEQEQLNQLFWEMDQEGIYTEDEQNAKKDQMIELLQKQVEELKGQITQQEDTIKDLQDQWGNLEAQLGQTNAEAGQILKDYRAYSKGQLVTGSMPNYAGATIAWSGYETISVQQHPADSTQALVTITNSYNYPGYYDSSSKITGNIANLYAENIRAGVNVGRIGGGAGITGTFTADATATANNLSSGATAYVNGQKIVGNGADVNNAYNNGYNVGYNAGYNVGYNAGKENGKSSLKSATYSFDAQLGDDHRVVYDTGKQLVAVMLNSCSYNVYKWQQNYNAYINAGVSCSVSGTSLIVQFPGTHTNSSSSGGKKNTTFTVTYFYFE